MQPPLLLLLGFIEDLGHSLLFAHNTLYNRQRLLEVGEQNMGNLFPFHKCCKIIFTLGLIVFHEQDISVLRCRYVWVETSQ